MPIEDGTATDNTCILRNEMDYSKRRKNNAHQAMEFHGFSVSMNESLSSRSYVLWPSPDFQDVFFSILLYGCQSSGTSIRCTHSGKKQCTTSSRSDTLDLTGSSSYPHASKELEESYDRLKDIPWPASDRYSYRHRYSVRCLLAYSLLRRIKIAIRIRETDERDTKVAIRRIVVCGIVKCRR